MARQVKKRKMMADLDQHAVRYVCVCEPIDWKDRDAQIAQSIIAAVRALLTCVPYLTCQLHVARHGSS